MRVKDQTYEYQSSNFSAIILRAGFVSLTNKSFNFLQFVSNFILKSNRFKSNTIPFESRGLTSPIDATVPHYRTVSKLTTNQKILSLDL